MLLLVASAAPAQIVYPRGDADCSARLSAVDLTAAVRGAGGSSVCGNDDCDRDGAVTPADLTCTVDCLFGTCPTPPNAPRVTGVAPQSAPSIVPLSVISVSVDNLGSSDRLKRVMIGDAEAEIVGTANPNTFLVLVPNIEPGATSVIVDDGDLAGFPFPITVAAPVPVGAPDTLDSSLDLVHQVLVGLESLNLEQVYGDDAEAVRSELVRVRSALAVERARLAADPTFTQPLRAQLDAAFDSSGLPERLRQLLADINAIGSGGAAAGAEGGGAAIDPFTLIAIASTLIASIAGLAAGGLALGAATAIASVLVNVAATLGLGAAGVVPPPKINHAEFESRSGSLVLNFKAVEGGVVAIFGERLAATSVVMSTLRNEIVLAPEASGSGFVQGRIPSGVYGVCGSAAFFVRQTVPPFLESNQLRYNVLPELEQILGPDPAKPGNHLRLAVRGVAGCDATAGFHGTSRTVPAPLEYLTNIVSFATVPGLEPGNYQVDLAVGGQTTSPPLPLQIMSPITELRVSCAESDLLVNPGPPFKTICTAEPLPAGVLPIDLQSFRWTSSDTGIVSIREMSPVEGKGQATVTAVAPGTANVSATVPILNVKSNDFPITVRDVDPPSVTLSAPSTADPDASISVSVSASDNVLVKRIVLSATGDTSSGDQEFPCTQKTCANSFTVGLKSTGSVILVADAFDESGNTGHSDAVRVTINPPPADTTPPVVMITAPPDGGTVNAGETVQASVHASDNQPGDSGVQRVVIDVSGDALVGGAHADVTLPAVVPDTTQMVSFTVKSAADLANVTNKSIVITAQGFDAAGNTASQSATVSVLGTLDMCDGGIQAAPTSGHIEDPFTITVAIAGPAASRVAKVTSTNPGGSYDLTKQGDVYVVTLFFEGQGSFTLSFTALDADGHSLCSGSIGLTSLGPNG